MGIYRYEGPIAPTTGGCAGCSASLPMSPVAFARETLEAQRKALDRLADGGVETAADFLALYGNLPAAEMAARAFYGLNESPSDGMSLLGEAVAEILAARERLAEAERLVATAEKRAESPRPFAFEKTEARRPGRKPKK